MTTSTGSDTNTGWSAVATGWDANRRHVEAMKSVLSDRMLHELWLHPGAQVAELAAGTGEFARRLAAAVGPTGRVLATDVAAGMVALVRRTVADLPNVEVAQLDAADTGLPASSYDAVACRMGLMFLADPAAGVAEIARILRPGGRLAVATWAGPEHNPWLSSVGFAAVMAGLLAGPMPTDPGGPFSLGDAGRLTELAQTTGLADVTVSAVDLVVDFPDVAAYIAHVTAMAPPIAAALDAATPDQRATFDELVEQAVATYRTPDGLRLPARALLLAASR